jgi:signal transduction histidine kinase
MTTRVTRVDEPHNSRSVAAQRVPSRLTSTRQRVATFLFTEPWWLRGVTWRLIGMIALIAFMQIASHVSDALVLPEKYAPSWSFVLYELANQLIVGVSITVVASVLMNIRRPRIPLPMVLTVAVLLGTFVPIDAVGFMNGGVKNLVFASMNARRIALPWAFAAAAWYFLNRANAREAALRVAEMARRQLETGTLEARLQTLQAQVEPHFLFNTLAHVRRLYQTDRIGARLMLDSFRAYLRSALPQMRVSSATLGHELDLARAYLDVQQVRMGRRLSVHLDVEAGLRDCAFPSMMLLSLVENAIKHGLDPLPRGGSIGVRAAERDGLLEISVTDTGCGIGEKVGSGVGLANIRGRLAAMHGSRAWLSLAPNAPSGARATIGIPTTTPAHVLVTDPAPEITL